MNEAFKSTVISVGAGINVGQPSVPVPRADAFDVAANVPKPVDSRGRRVNATYDAARDGNETINLWKFATSLDADACNSLAIRTKLRNRSREERANSGYYSGIIGTHVNYIIGTGPKLRLKTRGKVFNQMVEARWQPWMNASGFVSWLRLLFGAKVADGESVGILFNNPAIKDSVSLDMMLVECDKLTAPTAKLNTEKYVDGIHFDEFGNPTFYDILNQHPGSAIQMIRPEAEFQTLRASHVIHWYKPTRPGQHRGIPEMTPTLSLHGTGRRFREATVAAAETAADFAMMIEMGMASEGNDEVAPFTTLPIEKRMLTVMPAGAKASQIRAEHPSTTYESFTRQIINESARPLSMPYNIASCDSSDYTFSGGQLDHQTYFVSVNVERQSCQLEVLDRVFTMWFAQAVWIYGWVFDPKSVPRHGWIWSKKPQNDPVKTALARKHTLALGGTTLSDIYAEDGEDFEDKIEQMAADFGVDIETMRTKLFDAVFPQQGGAPGTEQQPASQSKTDGRGNGLPTKANGHNRLADYIQGVIQ